MKQLSLIPIACLFAACSPDESREEGTCSADKDCAVPSGVCDLGGSGTCVQCVPFTKTGACVGTTPICDARYQCQKCTRHADCLSDACVPDGSCAGESQVLYLREGGMGAACTRTAPCGTLEAALGALSNTQAIVRVSGQIANAEGAIAFGKATFLGDSAGAVLRGGGSNAAAPILTLINGARVEIYDVALRDSRAAAISVSGSSTAALIRSRIDNAAGEGIIAMGRACGSRRSRAAMIRGGRGSRCWRVGS